MPRSADAAGLAQLDTRVADYVLHRAEGASAAVIYVDCGHILEAIVAAFPTPGASGSLDLLRLAAAENASLKARIASLEVELAYARRCG